jgi:hypothetical protein
MSARSEEETGEKEGIRNGEQQVNCTRSGRVNNPVRNNCLRSTPMKSTILSSTRSMVARREEKMRKPQQAGPWVVYRMTLHFQHVGMAVCEQAEWDELERERPGYHTLVKAGIASESEAERLARGTSGDRVIRLRARV